MTTFAGEYRLSRKLRDNSKNVEKMLWVVHKPSDRNKQFVLKSSVNQQTSKEEYEIMKKLDHKNIVKVFDEVFFDFNGCKYSGIVMEYLLKGDLESFLAEEKERNADYWDETDALRLITQLISGLSYLHQHQIIHRDLKPSNIFLCDNNRLAIGDFGISDSLETTRMTRIIGTDHYLPPEALEDFETEQLTFARDVWACGIVIFMISYFTHPFVENNRMRTLMNICEVKILPHPRSFSKCDALIKLCLQKEVEKRVGNACILAKNQNIESLIYQYDFGIPPSEFSFSEGLTSIVQSVNSKLIEDLKDLQMSSNDAIKNKDQFILKLEAEKEQLKKKLSEEEIKNKTITKNLNVKTQALSNSKRANQEKTKALKASKSEIAELNSQIDDLKNASIFTVAGQRKGLGFYFGDDGESIRSPINLNAAYHATFVIDALETGLRKINLKFYYEFSVNFTYKNWTIRSPAFEKIGDKHDFSRPWKLAISNPGRKIKYRATAENIRIKTGKAITKVENIESGTIKNIHGEEEVVEAPIASIVGFMRWNIEFLE
ncbi:Oidioi.mRNA.OKI2018_I69.XSR.g13605.t1.cds [Oikopleura dioica]|uniref:non-specific serine/threonine protein kinase n=1 Tax=Oikopleura dioica TaxID=34765 RepID=A0ABN7S7D1_OIKDI|nr:Oidioi.mRNA.OKI2018_I69.XSR.g13605.t1.cds [Oikopleura dioica]